MTTSRPRPAFGSVLTVLFVFWPFVLVFLLIALVGVLLLGGIVVAAFQAGFVEGCGALSALIGVPSFGLLWLRAAVRLFGLRTPPAAPVQRVSLGPSTAERYAAGDFEHRDYEAEKREWEAFRQQKGW